MTFSASRFTDADLDRLRASEGLDPGKRVQERFVKDWLKAPIKRPLDRCGPLYDPVGKFWYYSTAGEIPSGGVLTADR